jgi:predicted 3-demethylubiquinone-9 3-methyltransferase (glyoxalase superfamily)
MQKITPFLWFDDKAGDAAKFYVSVFMKSKLGSIARYDDAAAKASGRPAGSVMTVSFELNGQEFVALNGGPIFTFHACHIIRRELPHPGRGGPAMEEAL